ncbi:MAG: lipid hydroperoxide peroxidase [Bacteroidetes bacterium RIFOXYA12_FULL_35_11]|nr:MAG: lipid hydroperoxide peroxidase [Bacteroidetes bacterium GWF2_35_48]OFY72777.1 MAG: lipid hydroperoxide peroxidase [Bacteroidetes bacterium RIFOXYA12_FULL_35_11]OFY95371.1 MAG: lipid hydroperoxide peroxidase [Bacteroidetes bacterium RIFOXYC12_FULL_35_7]HBX52237.1 thiol peroxidase [Bacteroidales bacterium]
MAQITLKGNPFNTIGELPKVGDSVKNFVLVKSDLSRVTLRDFQGTRIVMNIFPSLDTGTCAASVRQFNKLAGDMKDTKVLCISRDLPFAQARFCGAEGLENVITLSDFATGEFGQTYGLEIIDGPLQNLHSRVVIIIDKEGKVIYTEQVSEIANEPDYAKALEALK